jgi:non-specific serine/threonine protein kinase
LGDDPFSAARCLEALAWIAADRHREERAAVLIGAAETVQRSMGAGPIMFPNLQVHHDNCENQCRRALGMKGYDAAYRTGTGLHFEAAIAVALDEKTPTARTDAPTVLTRREHEVANLVAQGLTNKAIAERLVISHRTAQGHVEHILAKLGFTSRTQIAAWVSDPRPP